MRSPPLSTRLFIQLGLPESCRPFDNDNPQKIAVALQDIAKQCGVQVPVVTVKEATQAKVNAAVKRKGLHLQSTLTSSMFTLAEGFFNNEDGSPAQILPVFSTTESGVTLMDYKDSQEWVGSTKLTADELAIVVLGTAHSFQEVVGQKISFPAIDQQGSSLVLNGVSYQLGEKLIKVNTSNRTMIKGTDSVVSLCMLMSSTHRCGHLLWLHLFGMHRTNGPKMA